MNQSETFIGILFCLVNSLLYFIIIICYKSLISPRVMKIMVKKNQQNNSSNYLIFCSTFHFKWDEYSNFIHSNTDILSYNFINILTEPTFRWSPPKTVSSRGWEVRWDLSYHKWLAKLKAVWFGDVAKLFCCCGLNIQLHGQGDREEYLGP